ncbi:MAG: hypothetical protein QNJ97_12210 [Myxococcota bacterium]|nr:hypothetical protein [Myxococcota bacterium]
MSTKEAQETLVTIMHRWQKIEGASVGSTGKVFEKSNNPIVRTVMEIIQRDSMMHHRVQGMIADSLSVPTRAFSLTPDELGDVWGMIEKHLEIEKKTIDLAKEALATIKGKQMPIHEYLINYLLIDEEKHNKILDALEAIKKGMYPYA